MLPSNLADAELTIGLKEAAEDIGLALKPVMKRVGLNARVLDGPEGYIAWSKWDKLLELVAAEMDCSYFGLLIAAHQPAVKLGLMGQIMKLSPDVGTAIAKAQQYATTYSHTVYWETHIGGGFITLNRKMHHQPGGPLGQCSSLSVAQAYKAMQALCGQDWRPTEVRFIHAAPNPSAVRRYREFFKVPVSFSQVQDCLVFPEKDFERQIGSADAQLLAIVEAHAASIQAELKVEQNLADLVRFLIRKNLSSGGYDINFIADVLALHPKTLHRRLKKFSLTFKQVLNQERHKLAQYYLSKSEIRISEVAELLGYSEASAMSRAFKQYCGLSPQDWKRQFGDASAFSALL